MSASPGHWTARLRAVRERLHLRPRPEMYPDAPIDPDSGLRLAWLDTRDDQESMWGNVAMGLLFFFVLGPASLAGVAAIVQLALEHRHDPLPSLVPIALACALFFFVFLAMGLAGTLVPLNYWGVTRLPLRLRTFVFGSFPTRRQHLALYAVVLVACPAAAVRLVSWFHSLPLHDPLLSLTGEIEIALGFAYLFVASAYHAYRALPPSHPSSVSARDPAELPPHAEGAGVARIAHWSDLHLTGAFRRRTEGGAGGDEALARLIERHRSSLHADVTAIVASGDVTDSGQMSQWDRFFGLLDPALIGKLVLVPGNHDINISATPWFTLLDPQDRRLRLLRFLVAANRAQGERAFFVGRDGELRTLRSRLLEEAETLNDFLRLRHLAGGSRLTADEQERLADVARRPEAIWGSVFPMAITLDPCRLVVIVVDSIDPSSSGPTNAFGNVGEDQRARLRDLIARFPDRPKIVTLHHHLSGAVDVREGPEKIRKVAERAMGIHDAAPLAAMLAESVGVLLNGHRHVEYMADLGGLTILSAPSTTLGDELRGRKTPGFRTFGIEHAGERARIVSTAWME